MEITCRPGSDWRPLKELGGSSRVERIWSEGNIEGEWWKKAVAVVGSRKMSEYGRKVVDKLVCQLVGEGKIIVSGFMYGVDQEAHRCCSEMGGKTVAVLGWGINWSNPRVEDNQLRKDIVEGGGMVVSEWDMQEPMLWTFPRRNRIVAALAEEIYIVEAAEKSGALITAEWGRKLGKKLWAVPGPITSRVSAGTNKLIAQGIAEAWLPNDSKKPADTVLYINKTDISHLLQNDGVETDELANYLKLGMAELNQKMAVLELQGKVKWENGKWRVKEE